MEALSVREYRNNLAASFTKADNGEQVLIRRKNEIYALVKVGREDLMITPELQARIDKAREVLEHPKTGLGHPEALRGGGDITWSRHITAHDRIIYDIYEEVVEVYILEVEGHYNDK
jgi:toxin YoeB